MARRRSPVNSARSARPNPRKNVARILASSSFSSAVSLSSGLSRSSRNRWRRRSMSGSAAASRASTWRASMLTVSMSRACSHWPVKFFISASDRGSVSIRLICAVRFFLKAPSPARRNNSASGIDDQKKYDSLEARAYSSTNGCVVVAAGVPPAVEGGILPPGGVPDFARPFDVVRSFPPGGTPGSTAGETPATTSIPSSRNRNRGEASTATIA